MNPVGCACQRLAGSNQSTAHLPHNLTGARQRKIERSSSSKVKPSSWS